MTTIDVTGRALRFLSECQETARSDKNKYKHSHHGAIVTSGGTIFGSGFNNSLRCYVRGKRFYTTHAEMMAIMMSGLTPLSKKGKYSSRRGMNCGNHKRSYDLWVIRLSAKNDLKNSYPCNLCIQMMKDYGISRVFYSDKNGDIICTKVNEIEMIRDSFDWSGDMARIKNKLY